LFAHRIVGYYTVNTELKMSSKKEEQRRTKLEKQAAAAQKQKVTTLVTKIALGILVPLVVAVLLYGFFTGQPALPPDAVSATDHVKGELSNPVILTVYGDFQCPACREEAAVITRAWPRIADKAKVVFRHYPLDTHNHAFLAARYAEAAARQQRFWEFYEVLYSKQSDWESMGEPATLFEGYAKDLGLDLSKLHSDIDDPTIRDKILADQRGGTRAGVRATPALYINGRATPAPRTPAELIALVEKAAQDLNQ
jgi:protein-disulfide isomerase